MPNSNHVTCLAMRLRPDWSTGRLVWRIDNQLLCSDCATLWIADFVWDEWAPGEHQRHYYARCPGCGQLDRFSAWRDVSCRDQRSAATSLLVAPAVRVR